MCCCDSDGSEVRGRSGGSERGGRNESGVSGGNNSNEKRFALFAFF